MLARVAAPLICLISALCLLSLPDASLGDQPVGAVWTPVTEDLLHTIETKGLKVSWPGGTAGVSVDRASGEIRVVVPDQGIWRSRDDGKSFERLDGGAIGGRCETGYALNANPAGRGLACFMLDGKSGMTTDGGRTWTNFEPHGRGWDYGAVDWSVANPREILAVHHESGCELHHSSDGGRSWKLLGKDFTAVGLFGADALVATRGEGILRSRDGGVTWDRVSKLTPTGRTLCVFKGVGYWLGRDGVIVSRDRGVTWSVQGAPIEAAWGPYFGKDERDIVVAGRLSGRPGIWRTPDAGKSWTLVASFPAYPREPGPDWTPSKQWAAGWFTNLGWDSRHNALYASRMGHPALRFDLGTVSR